MHTNGTYSKARPRPPRREFVTTICSEELGRYAGVGLTLEQVIEEELRNVHAVAPARVEESDDLVIWEGTKIAALIRIGVDGRPAVTRPGGPTAPPGAPDRELNEIPLGDPLDLASGGQEFRPSMSAVSATRAAITRFQALRRIDEDVRQHSEQASQAGASSGPGNAVQDFWQRWKNLVCEMLTISESSLCETIDKLTATVRCHPHRHDAACRCSRSGVIQGGRLYLVLDGAAGKALVVIELKNLFRLDAGRGGVPTEYV